MEKIDAKEEDINLMAKLHLRDGLSNREMAKEIGKSPVWCVRVLREAGLYVDKPSGMSKDEYLKEKNKKWNNRHNIEGKDIFFDDSKKYKAICKKTKKEFEDYLNLSGILSEHIFSINPDYRKLSKYKRSKLSAETGKPWYAKFFDFIEYEPKKRKLIFCKDCEWSTSDIHNSGGHFTAHIHENHGSIKEYTNRHPEDSHLFKTALYKEKYKGRFIDANHTKFVTCKVCNKKFGSITNSHLKKHGLDHETYKEKFGGKIVSQDVSEQISKQAIESNLKRPLNFTSSTEQKFKDSLNKIDGWSHQVRIGGFMYDFVLFDSKIIIEVDGRYWHAHDRKEEFTYIQIHNFMRDVKKDELAKKEGYKIFRIMEDVVEHLLPLEFSGLDELLKFLNENSCDIMNHQLLNLKEYDVIYSKEYCIRNSEIISGSDDLIDNLVEFWHRFYPPKKYLSDCIDLSKRNQQSLWLKGVMKNAYYKAKKGGSKSLEELFEDKELLKKVVEYRVGRNKSKEFFDVSLRQLYKGIEVRTMYNVGVFPIKQAKEIYKSYISQNSRVYDPYAGWGSRLIGCCENSGYYIGNDINKELKSGYNFLRHQLKFNKKSKMTFSDSRIYKPNLKDSIDFIFTSPPFYDDEIYTDQENHYNSIEKWTEKELLPVFINCFDYLKSGCFIVIDMSEKYVKHTKEKLETCGFINIKTESYNVKKSHYSKKANKSQVLITMKKP